MLTLIHDGEGSYWIPNHLYVSLLTNKDLADLAEGRDEVLADPKTVAQPLSDYIPDSPVETLTRLVKAWLPQASVCEINGELQVATGLKSGGGDTLNGRLCPDQP